jgi:hypothetical protein
MAADFGPSTTGLKSKVNGRSCPHRQNRPAEWSKGKNRRDTKLSQFRHELDVTTSAIKTPCPIRNIRKTSEKLKPFGCFHKDVDIVRVRQFGPTAYLPQKKLVIEANMANRSNAQSCETTGIHLVQENGKRAIQDSDFAPASTPRLPVRYPHNQLTAPACNASEASRPIAPGKPTTLSLVNSTTVLKELFELLEEYSPVWYTEDNHNRALAALAQTAR